MNKQASIVTNHIGFLCHSKKTAVIPFSDQTNFEIQDMTKVAKENLGEYENWQTVYKGRLVKNKSHMQDAMMADFSSLTTPGHYRIVIPDLSAYSYQFVISDGIFHPFIGLFLDNIHNKRSGNFENEWRTAINTDDALRSDNGKPVDVSGGWNDAGDLRKWMTTANLPILGFLDILENLQYKRNHFASEKIADNDLVTESIWGLKFILKMQDNKTGMFYEEVGGGGEARKQPGMSWWYDNHSGCLADNSQNRFTDNITGSGDERSVRVAYNPIVQYISITILLRSYPHVLSNDPSLAENLKNAALKSWKFMESKVNDDFHQWTSVISWRIIAGLTMNKLQLLKKEIMEDDIKKLLSNFSDEFGFWWMDTNKKDPYRGILHSAQPLIALLLFLERYPDHHLNHTVKEILNQCIDEYIFPITQTNPYQIMPYGLYASDFTTKDQYRPFRNGFKFRFFMPDHSPQRINHGLGGHWTSWAHAFALAGKALNKTKLTELAWQQLFWLWGFNPLSVCSVDGIGYNNPMPHSRFLGTMVGGFQVGARGNANDEIVIDQEGRAEWSSTEYWNVPTANALMALSILLPKDIKQENKLGFMKKL